MSAAATRPDSPPVIRTTMLELVLALGSVLDDDREVASLARRMVRSGAVELTGTFRGQRLD